MGRTPDRLHGPLQEHDHIQMFSDGDPGIGEGVIRYVEGSPDHFEMVDGTGAFDPRTGGDPVDFDSIVLTVEGTIVYIGNGEFVTI